MGFWRLRSGWRGRLLSPGSTCGRWWRVVLHWGGCCPATSHVADVVQTATRCSIQALPYRGIGWRTRPSENRRLPSSPHRDTPARAACAASVGRPKADRASSGRLPGSPNRRATNRLHSPHGARMCSRISDGCNATRRVSRSRGAPAQSRDHSGDAGQFSGRCAGTGDLSRAGCNTFHPGAWSRRQGATDHRVAK